MVVPKPSPAQSPAKPKLAELDGMPLEIERKYLLLAEPDLAMPELAAAERVEIATTFLRRDGEWKERLREKVDASGSHYYLTRKRRVSALVQEEDEREITAAEHATLAEGKDPARQVIRKTRLTFPYEGRQWELDLYREPAVGARLEIELADPDEQPEPPAFLGPLREVSTDKRYSDRALAKHGRPVEPGLEL